MTCSGSMFFKRFQWRPRHCILTTSALHWYTHQDGALKGSIDLTTCTLQSLEAMPRDCPTTGRSVATEWRIAIQTPTARYFLSAVSERDMYEWLDALKVAIKLNDDPIASPASWTTRDRVMLYRVCGAGDRDPHNLFNAKPCPSSVSHSCNKSSTDMAAIMQYRVVGGLNRAMRWPVVGQSRGIASSDCRVHSVKSIGPFNAPSLVGVVPVERRRRNDAMTPATGTA
ncbi:hypothetical protein DYB32_010349 [Aphanomyces invadans]|uniref:PH domain-containing protein n=1 Tax=Aphanomyces invadans TaxID=157072 RepID=A0A3R6VPC6_9STRA|nr:hypothetical protein DYB32_010349 [Aphanomyces invadans]